MKMKCALSFLVAAMLGISLAADAVQPETAMTLGEMIRLSCTGGKKKELRSAKLIYEVSGPKLPVSFMIVRAEAPENARFDIITAKERYIACRNSQIFWGYNDKSGVSDLTPEEIREMKCDLAFLPIPFLGSHAYAPMTPAGQGVHRDFTCNIFKTYPIERPSEKVSCWVDSKSGLLRLIKIESEDGYYSSYYRSYQEIDDVKVASEIHISSANGVVKMKLYSVDWNPQLPENLFLKGAVTNGTLVQELQKELATRKVESPAPAPKSVSDEEKAKAAEKAAKDRAAAKAAKEEVQRQEQMEKLDKEIRHLDIEIADREKKMSNLEKLFAADRNDAVAVTQNSSRYNYRNAWGYRGWYRSGSRRAANDAKRVAKKLEAETEEVAEEYKKISKDLTDLRIQRSDAQAALEKLQRQNKQR